MSTDELLRQIATLPLPLTPEWVSEQAALVAALWPTSPEAAARCERALYRAVLKGVDLKGCEDASLCAFVALTKAPQVNAYQRDWTANDA